MRYALLLLIGIGILFFLVLLTNYIKERTNDSQQVIDEYFSKRDHSPLRIPRTDEIPIEIRQKFASVPAKPELIAEFAHGDYLKKVAFPPTNPNLIVSLNSNSKTEKNIKLRDINNSANPITEFHGDSVSISPDGKMLATSDMDSFEEPVRMEVRNIVFREQGDEIVLRKPLNEYSMDTVVSKFAKLFGLTLDYRHPSYLMSYEKKTKQLSKSSAEWLNKCLYFNSEETFFDDMTKIEKLSPSMGKVRFQVEDADGISQVRLLVRPTPKYSPENIKQKDTSNNKTEYKNGFSGRSYGLHDFLTLNGEKKATVEFDRPNHVDNVIELHVIDELGNRVYVHCDIKAIQSHLSFVEFSINI